MRTSGLPLCLSGPSAALAWTAALVLMLAPQTVGVTADDRGVIQPAVSAGDTPRGLSRPCRQAEPTTGSPECPDMRVGLAELMGHLRARHVLLIDVRDPAAYWRGHLPGALSMPFEGLEMLALTLRASDVLVVTYGDETSDGLSLRATRELRRLGVTEARAFEDGFQAWVAAGHVVVTQPS